MSVSGSSFLRCTVFLSCIFPSGTYIDTWRGRIELLTGNGLVGSNIGFDGEGRKQEGLLEFPLHLRPPWEEKQSQLKTNASVVTTCGNFTERAKKGERGHSLACADHFGGRVDDADLGKRDSLLLEL